MISGGRRAASIGLVLAGLGCAPLLLTTPRLYSFTEVVILALFAVSYNLLFGYLGLLSFGHSAYFGLGAYATALVLFHWHGLPVLLAVVLGTAAGALGGIVIGNFCVRLSGPYFAMLTLAFGQLLFAIAWKWRALTRGDDGFGEFVKHATFPLLRTLESPDQRALYYLVVSVIVPVVGGTWLLMTRTPFGNFVVSVRQNEERAVFLGYDVLAIKLVTYTLAAGLAGLAGSLSAIFHDFVSPSAIDLTLSTDVVLMTFIGGTVSFFGPVLGAAFFVYFSDFISALTDRWQIIMGVIFVLIVLFAPGGLVGFLERIPKFRLRSVRSEAPR